MDAIHFLRGEIPPGEKVVGLYQSVGWSTYLETGPGRLMDALVHSTYVVSAWDGERLIGLARLISDHVTIFFLQDILVDPAYQRSGVGRQLMGICLEYCQHVDRGVLITDGTPGQDAFYREMGFTALEDLEDAELKAYLRLKPEK